MIKEQVVRKQASADVNLHRDQFNDWKDEVNIFSVCACVYRYMNYIHHP